MTREQISAHHWQFVKAFLRVCAHLDRPQGRLLAERELNRWFDGIEDECRRIFPESYK